MPKKKLVKRKVVKHSSKKHTAPKSSANNPFAALLHKKHRPLHFAGVGIILVLLKGVLAIFATVGILLIILSSLAYIWRAAKHSTK